VNHERKYGNRPSHPFYVWNGVLEAKHRRQIGPAIWEFLWLLDCITKEKDGIGKVWNGKPVNYQKIAESFEVNEKTIRSHFDRLEEKGYIERTLTPRGHSIRVLNSKKWTKSGRKEMPDHPAKMSDHSEENVRPNKTKQLDKALEQAVGLPLAPFWKEMGIDPERLSGGVRKLCEDLYTTKGNQSPVEFLSACMDAIQAMGWRIPPRIAQAAAELRTNESGYHQREPIRELEPEPWGAGVGGKQ